MEQSFLLEYEERDCPICNKVHKVEKRTRNGGVLIKEKPISFQEIYYVCPDCPNDEENEFVSAEMMDVNFQTARNEYRKLYGLLTSDEIVEIRSFYNMSQADLSIVLGWGEITITRYESKSIQDETYDQILRMAKKDPYFVLERLQKQKDKISNDKYEQLKASIDKRIEEFGNAILNQKSIESQYLLYDEPSEYNGYQMLNIEKLQNVISFFAHYYGGILKVKLMKLLWYVDALSFKSTGKAVTGLVYRHMPYGALPIAYSEIIHLPGLSVEEIENDDTTMYRITSLTDIGLSKLSQEEIDVVYQVAKKFQGFNASSMVEYMHKEAAYTNTYMQQIIPFSLCKTLNEF